MDELKAKKKACAGKEWKGPARFAFAPWEMVFSFFWDPMNFHKLICGFEKPHFNAVVFSRKISGHPWVQSLGRLPFTNVPQGDPS